MQISSGLPTKYGSQMHFPLAASQVAPMPQITPSHLCLQRPLMQTCGSAHGLLVEHWSVVQAPPGNGFPISPGGHLQVGPVLDTMHIAPWPHMYPSHSVEQKRRVVRADGARDAAMFRLTYVIHSLHPGPRRNRPDTGTRPHASPARRTRSVRTAGSRTDSRKCPARRLAYPRSPRSAGTGS